MRKKLTPIVITITALTVAATSAQAAYLECLVEGKDDGGAQQFNYTTNEAQSTLTETIPSTGSTETHGASYSLTQISASWRVASTFPAQVLIDRQTGKFRRKIAHVIWKGTCSVAEPVKQLF